MLGRTRIPFLLAIAAVTGGWLTGVAAQQPGMGEHQMPQQPGTGQHQMPQHPGMGQQQMPQHPGTGEHGGMTQPGGAPPSAPAAPGHGGEHGTPPGWKLSWPKGDPAKGREVFVKMDCYSCHEVRGEKFPAPTEPGKVGPELAAMGPLHEVEYFVEAMVNPTATIQQGKGYEAPDGSSKMPSFNDAMTVQELVDLVAFLKSLTPPAATTGGRGGH